jgi:ubiquinone/menaquinone biosynthesis C-methylase UbiE
VIRALEISEGETVVDVGCGTGALLIDAARIVGRTGRVVGVEPQSHLEARARERVADEGVARYAEVMDGRGESLPVASESANVALASTVLIHLPLAAATATLREMVRVVTRNGRVAAIEQDTNTWTIDHPDRELTRRIIAFNSDQRSADGWRGRHLRRMFLEADLDTDVSTFVHVDPVEAPTSTRSVKGSRQQGSPPEPLNGER